MRFVLTATIVALSYGAHHDLPAASSAAGNRPDLLADSTIVRPPPGPEDDGWLDLSSFLEQPYGFLPVVSPITEPAVGYGVFCGPTFLSKPKSDMETGFGRPNITFIGGMWTENGTWGVMAGDVHRWMDERMQTAVGVIYASVNLDFYGIGKDAALKDNPIRYTLTPTAAGAQVKYRLGRSLVWLGLGYAFAKTHVEVAASDAPRLANFPQATQVGGLLPLVNFDSRDNIFTPASGTVAEISAGLFSKALGGDGEFQRVSLMAIQYLSPYDDLIVGMRGDGLLSFGDVPFYMRPYIGLRGAPVMRYQGEHVAQIELEAAWQFWKRISLVGFVGYGAAWNNLAHFENQVTIVTGGTGLRYELARRYGLHAGVDVAFGPAGTAIYIQFGSAWMRP